MATRARRAPARAADPSGGNVLFTLGLVSVVALLIVGYIMTNGGVNTISSSSSGDNNQSIFISPTPSPVPTQAAGGQVNSIVLEQLNQLQAKVDSLESQNQALSSRLSEEKQTYSKEVANLKMRIQTLIMENERLQKEVYGEK